MSDSAVIANSGASPVAGAAAEKKAKKAVSGLAKAKKPSAAPTHPPTQQMVDASIKSLKERGGSSLLAIKKFISATYKCDAQKLAPFIKKYLKTAVASGKLIQTKGKGASGSFKLSAAAVAPKKSTKPKAASIEKKSKKPTTAAASKKKPTTAAKKAAVGDKKKPKKSIADKKKSEKAKAKDIKKSGTVKAKTTSKATTKSSATKPKAPKTKVTTAAAAKAKKAATSAPKKAAASKKVAKK